MKEAESNRLESVKKTVIGLYDSQRLLAESHNAWTAEISEQIARINLKQDIEEIVEHGVN